MTVPLPGVPLTEHAAMLGRLQDAGYGDFWTSEVRGFDALTPLPALAAAAPGARLGAAIAGVYSRGPALLAMQAAAVSAAAPGRFALGIGTSSETIVEGWNDRRFERPLARTRDSLRFLRSALAGERIDQRYETFSVRGFSLEHPPEIPPPILVAALRERMLELAGREADGVCLGMLGAEDVARVIPIVNRAGRTVEVFLRVAVVVRRDASRARRAARRLIGPYLAAGPYARFHEWLGRGDEIAKIRAGFAAGDRDAVEAAIPDALVDSIVVHGEPDACRAGLQAFLDAGVTTLCIDVVGSDSERLEAQQAVIPRS